MKGLNRTAKKIGAVLTALSLGFTSFAACPQTGSAKESDSKGVFQADQFYHYTESGTNGDIVSYSFVNSDGETLPDSVSSADGVTPKKAQDLPESYDSRDYGYITSIKNQGKAGICWSFATMKALEANSIKKGLADETVDYSESHLAWYSNHDVTDTAEDALYGDGMALSSTTLQAYMEEGYTEEEARLIDEFNVVYEYGGNWFYSAGTLANWWGPADEDADPALEFTADTTEDVVAMTERMKEATGQSEDLRNLSEVHLKEVNVYDDDADIDEIKTAVMEYGAAFCAFCMGDMYSNAEYGFDIEGLLAYRDSLGIDENTPEDDPRWAEFYEELAKNQYAYVQTYSVYNSEEEDPDHGVAIIGWDDNYAKENFKEGNQPNEDGAWLIANSYGEGDKFTDDGCIWISYEDKTLMSITTYEAEDPEIYDTNLAYDGSFPTDIINSEEEISVENIFTNSEDSALALNSVGIWTCEPGQDYRVEIYRNATPGDPDSGTLVAESVTEGTVEYAGYHTVELSNTVPIARGETFIVCVTFLPSTEYQEDDGTTSLLTYVYLEGESEEDEEGAESGFIFVRQSEAGQSFLKDGDEEWTDTTAMEIEIEESEIPGEETVTVNYNNVPVKALGHTISDEEYEALNPLETLTAAPGKVKGLSVTVGKKKMNVSWKAVEDADTYKVQYSAKKNFKKKKSVTVDAADGKKTTIKKLKRKTKYYVRVRAVAEDGTKGEWSKVVKVKTK